MNSLLRIRLTRRMVANADLLLRIVRNSAVLILLIALPETTYATEGLPFDLFETSPNVRPAKFEVLSYPQGEPASYAEFDIERLVRQVTIFAFVIACICAAVIIFANRRGTKRSENRQMSVVETISLGPKCSCDLLIIRGQYFVAGRDASGLKNLCPVGDFDESLFGNPSDLVTSDIDVVTDSPARTGTMLP